MLVKDLISLLQKAQKATGNVHVICIDEGNIGILDIESVNIPVASNKKKQKIVLNVCWEND